VKILSLPVTIIVTIHEALLQSRIIPIMTSKTYQLSPSMFLVVAVIALLVTIIFMAIAMKSLLLIARYLQKIGTCLFASNRQDKKTDSPSRLRPPPPGLLLKEE